MGCVPHVQCMLMILTYIALNCVLICHMVMHVFCTLISKAINWWHSVLYFTIPSSINTSCQIRIEISDYTGDKISVGVARPSRILGQSVPCDGWHSIPGTRVQHMCTESRIRAQGLIIRVTASWQLTDNTGIRSTQLTPLLMRSMCSWLITPCAAARDRKSVVEGKSVVSACIMPYIHASFIRKCMYLFTSLY